MKVLKFKFNLVVVFEFHRCSANSPPHFATCHISELRATSALLDGQTRMYSIDSSIDSSSGNIAEVTVPASIATENQPEEHTILEAVHEVESNNLREIEPVIPPTPDHRNVVSQNSSESFEPTSTERDSNIDQAVNENSSNYGSVAILSRPLRDEFEDVDSEENFTEDERSVVLFEDTQERNNVKMLGNNFGDTTEEETDDEDIDHTGQTNENFRDGYLLRGKPGKPRNSYSPPTPSPQNSSGKRPMFPTINQRRTVKTRRKSSTFPHMNFQKN